MLSLEEHPFHMDQSTIGMTWAQVGQVDLFWTNIGVKVYGIRFLMERTIFVKYFMKKKGNFDLTKISVGVIFPTTLVEIYWPRVSCDKASISQY